MTQGKRDDKSVWEFMNGRLVALEMLMKGVLAHQVMEQTDLPPSVFLRVIEKRLNAAVIHRSNNADDQTMRIMSYASQMLTKMCDEIDDVIESEK